MLVLTGRDGVVDLCIGVAVGGGEEVEGLQSHVKEDVEIWIGVIHLWIKYDTHPHQEDDSGT